MLCMSGMIDMMEITTSIIVAIVHAAALGSGWANEYDTCMCDHWTSKFDYVGNPVLAPVFPLVGTLVVFFGVAFALDFKIARQLGLTENISHLRRLVHLVMAKLVLWAYCITEYIVVAQLTIYGKAVCGHAPSQKDGVQKGHIRATMSLSSSSGFVSMIDV